MLDGRLIRLLVLALFAAACGDSDDGGTDSGTDSGPPVDSGTSTDSGTTPPPVTTIMCGTVECSAPMPPPLPADAGALPAVPGLDPSALAGMGALPCCTEADNACGVMSSTLFPNAGCIERDMPGVPDDSCPTIDTTFTVSALPFPIPVILPGCCTAMNQCGLDLSSVTVDVSALGFGTFPLDLGVGCMELTEADMLGGMSVTMADAGPVMSIPCGVSDDGGSDDGG